jgi:acyl-CoA synthetase (NDP forming)
MGTATRTSTDEATAAAGRARAEGRTHLLEPEGYRLLEMLGIRVPEHRFVRSAAAARAVDLDAFPGTSAVIKAVSASILHKTDVGGVAIVAKERDAIAAAIDAMARRLAGSDVAGYLLVEKVAYDPSVGGELLVGARWTEDFGPVVTLAPGGTHAEALARDLAPGKAVAVVSPTLTDPSRIPAILRAKTATSLATRSLRGQPPRLAPATLTELVLALARFASRFLPDPYAELEINPLVSAATGPVALDVLVRLGEGREADEVQRPLAKIGNLLAPRSLAIVGVSDARNPGRIILENTLRAGFDPERLFVVKPRRDRIDGCRCVPDVASLPGTVDVVVLAVDAAQAPGILETILDERKAESVIMIPGGLGEREGTQDVVRGLRRKLRASRATEWGGPVVNGGNCLGIRSVPGKYNTLFLPEWKAPFHENAASRLAVVSQSGAFLAAKSSALVDLPAKYLISIGNQIDLTLADYLTYLADDADLDVFACYAEGFRPGDGLRFVDVAARIAASGRRVILYRAGRTPTGAAASASHTAAVAGDYVVARELALEAGILVAESLADFVDLVRLAVGLRGGKLRGSRLGAISNAGYECVAIADNVGPFHLATFSDATVARLRDILRGARLDRIVDVRNPLDVTPILADAGFEDAARVILDDPNVDVGIVGCVPMTPALVTLARGPGHDEDIADANSVASRLARLANATSKPWVAVVDAGPLYSPFADALSAAGIPTFRSADRALRLLAALRRGREEPEE